MPAKGDHEARRTDVAEAVWRVLATHGFGGLTMRAVAVELGASTGLLTHYFTNKRELVRYANEIAAERTESRPLRTADEPGLTALRVALLNVLPTTPEDVAMSGPAGTVRALARAPAGVRRTGASPRRAAFVGTGGHRGRGGGVRTRAGGAGVVRSGAAAARAAGRAAG